MGTRTGSAAGPAAGSPGNPYDGWHRALAAREAAAGATAASGIWYDMVRRRLGEVSGLAVLEVGCGRGAFAIELAKAGARVTALDQSAAAVEIGIERARSQGVGVEFRSGDAAETGLASEAYDLVVSCECLEHVEQPERMAAELYRLCRPGGRCLLTTPSYLNASLLAWASSWVSGRPYNSGEGVQPRENFFLFFLVRRLLRRSGFIVLGEESRLYRWLLLPGVDPGKLQTREFRRRWCNRLARPFGLHFLFELQRPAGRR